MVSHGYASSRDEVIRSARDLVREDPVRFAAAGQMLDELYDEEMLKRQDKERLGAGEEIGKDRTPEQVRFMRLGAALDCLRDPASHRYDNHLDYESSKNADERRMIARMAVLVLLAATDPNKGEVINETMGEIATIPYEVLRFKGGKEQLAFGGSHLIMWNEEGWENHSEPSPDMLELFQEAIDVARHGSSEAAQRSRVPSGDGRPCDQPGKNKYDETVRALWDVDRYVGHFYYCVDHWRREWGYRHEDSTRREMEEIKIDNRNWWGKWSDVVRRAREAIRAVDLPELDLAKQKAFDALTVIAEIYSEPVMRLDHEHPGDHLFRVAHRSRTDEFQIKQRDLLVEALNDLDPLRRGCLLYIDEPDSDVKSEKEREMQPEATSGPASLSLTTFAPVIHVTPAFCVQIEQSATAATEDERKPGGKRSEIQRARHERELAVYLSKNPKATRKQAAEHIGVSEGTISGTRAWRVFKEAQKQARREARPVHFENLDELADPKSAMIRDTDGARALDSRKIKASNARRS